MYVCYEMVANNVAGVTWNGWWHRREEVVWYVSDMKVAGMKSRDDNGRWWHPDNEGRQLTLMTVGSLLNNTRMLKRSLRSSKSSWLVWSFSCLTKGLWLLTERYLQHIHYHRANSSSFKHNDKSNPYGMRGEAAEGLTASHSRPVQYESRVQIWISTVLSFSPGSNLVKHCSVL